MRIMASCPAIGEESGLPLCPAVVFFSALREVDDASQVVPADLRNLALALTTERLRTSDLDFKLELAKMTEFLEAQVDAGDIDFVTPLALLKASAAFDPGALQDSFRVVGLPLDILLRRIEQELPITKLADKPPGPIPTWPWPPEYAVVIEGPNFKDMRNRYTTLAEAEYAAEHLEGLFKGVAPTHKGPYQPIFVSRPPEFKRATKIYVKKLQNAN